VLERGGEEESEDGQETEQTVPNVFTLSPPPSAAALHPHGPAPGAFCSPSMPLSIAVGSARSIPDTSSRTLAHPYGEDGWNREVIFVNFRGGRGRKWGRAALRWAVGERRGAAGRCIAWLSRGVEVGAGAVVVGAWEVERWWNVPFRRLSR
jgi:hypothetical protein